MTRPEVPTPLPATQAANLPGIFRRTDPRGLRPAGAGSGGAVADPVSAVLFDVDGTLVDTNYLHAVSWWEAFAQAGHEVPMAWIHRAIGMGLDQLLDELLPAERDQATPI